MTFRVDCGYPDAALQVQATELPQKIWPRLPAGLHLRPLHKHAFVLGRYQEVPHRNLRDAQDARREIAREDACGAWSTFVRYCPCHSELRHSVIGKLRYQLQFPVDVALHVLARVVGAFIGAFVGIDRLGGKVAFRF